MSLERLIEEVQARNQAALDAETRRQDEERSRIALDRDRRIATAREEIARQSAADLARDRIQRLASAKLEARKRLFESQESRARAEIDQVRSLLSEFTEGPEYPRVLRKMFAFASSELGRSIRVAGRSEDAATLRAIAGKGFEPEPVPILGGLIASSSDGRRRLDLSLDELLRLREGHVRELLRN
jgi:vacuolar-type H+-ATPase subunit E/Vma4